MKRLLPIAAFALHFLLSPAALAAGPAPSAEALFGTTLTDLADRPVALERFRGRPLVVNFWARWCPPCVDEIPDLVGMRQKFKPRGVEVVGIAMDDSTALVRAFSEKYKMEYPILLAKDKGYAVMQALGNTSAGLPFTLVLDGHGRVVARKLGRMSKSEMETAFAAAAD